MIHFLFLSLPFLVLSSLEHVYLILLKAAKEFTLRKYILKICLGILRSNTG